MKERYKALYRYDVPREQAGTPVLLTAAVLQGDRRTGNVLAQMKFMNTGTQTIRALYARVHCLDVMNGDLGDDIEVKYIDLDAGAGACFGQKVPILIPDRQCRRFTAAVTDIMFADGAYWHNDTPAEMELIDSPENTLDDDQLEQLSRDTSGARFVISPADTGDRIRCACGCWNMREMKRCAGCGADLAYLLEISEPSNVQRRLNEYRRKEAESAERLRAEEEKRAKAEAKAEAAAKQKSRRIRVVAVLVVIALAAGGVIIGGNIRRDRKYADAVRALRAGEYESAREIFTEMSDYKDSGLLLREADADELYAEGNYADAYDIYVQLPEEYRIHEEAYAAVYTTAAEKAAAEKFDEAEALYRQLGNYSDAADRIEKVNILRKQAAARDKMAAGEYTAARALYIDLGDTEKANECRYRMAESLIETKPWQAYAAFVALGDYSDSSVRAAALYDRRYEQITDADANGLRVYYDPDIRAYGILDSIADVFVEPLYEEIRADEHGNYLVKYAEHFGVLGADGKEKIPVVYDGIRVTGGGYIAESEGKYALFGANGAVWADCVYDSIERTPQGYFRLKQGTLTGMLGSDGSRLLPVSYTRITITDEGFDVVLRGKQGKMNADGSQRIPAIFDKIIPVTGSDENTYFIVQQDNVAGLRNGDGSLLIPALYESVTPVENGFEVTADGKRGRFDFDGKQLIPTEYDSITPTDTGFDVVKNGLIGKLHADGTVLIDTQYESIEEIARMDGSSCFRVEKDGKFGLLTSDGGEFVPVEYESISLIDDGFDVTRDGCRGKLNADGTVLIDAVYDSIVTHAKADGTSFFEVRANGRIGRLKSDGTAWIPAVYDTITETDSGFDVTVANKCGKLNPDGTVWIKPEYDAITADDNGFLLKNEDHFGRAGTDGAEIIPPIYDEISIYMGPGVKEDDVVYRAELNGLFGLIGADGTVLFPTVLEELNAGSADGRYLRFKQNGLFGFMTAETFQTVVEPEWKDAKIISGDRAFVMDESGIWHALQIQDK